MSKLLKLQQQRAAAHDGLEAILAVAGDEGLSDTQAKEYDALEAKYDTLSASVVREEKRAARSLELEAASFVDAPQSDVADLEGEIVSQRDNRASDPSFGFAGLGDFASSIYNAGLRGQAVADPRLDFMAAATGLNQSTGSDGGFLVPPEYSTAIWDQLQEDESNLLSLTNNYTIQGESLEFPAIDETSRANGSRWGGVQGYWMNEADQMTSSKPKTRKVRIEPQELAVLVYVTDKMLRNSPIALQQWLTGMASSEIAFKVNDAIVNGTGVGQPVGIKLHASTISVAKETSQAAATILPANVRKMWNRLHPRARSKAVWLVNSDCEPQLDTLKEVIQNVAGSENVGGYGSQLYTGGSLKGRPVVVIEQAETLGTVGDLILWAPDTYMTGTRGGVKTDLSMHLRFDYNESAFRFLFEVDGQPIISSAITPFKGTTTQSTQVTLATRS